MLLVAISRNTIGLFLLSCCILFRKENICFSTALCSFGSSLHRANSLMKVFGYLCEEEEEEEGCLLLP